MAINVFANGLNNQEMRTIIKARNFSLLRDAIIEAKNQCLEEKHAQNVFDVRGKGNFQRMSYRGNSRSNYNNFSNVNYNRQGSNNFYNHNNSNYRGNFRNNNRGFNNNNQNRNFISSNRSGFNGSRGSSYTQRGSNNNFNSRGRVYFANTSGSNDAEHNESETLTERQFFRE